MATTSTDGNDTFVGTHTTMTALDTLDGGAGTDTLLYIDDSAAGTPLVVQFSNIETVAVRNLSGDAATTASAETATVGFQALAAGQTVIIAGVTFTAGSSGATAAEVAAAFAAPATAANDTSTIATANTLVVNGGTLTGITAATSVTEAAAAALVVDKIAAGGYTAAAGGQVNSVKFTSNADPLTNVTDLAVTGTAVTGIAQVTKIAITTEASAAMTLVINGDSVAVANGADLKADATNIANAINTYLGQVVAVVVPNVSSATDDDDDHNVIVTTNSIVNIASVTGTALVAPITNMQPFAAAAAPTVTIVDGVAAVAASTNAMTVDASAFEGVTTIMNTASTDAVTFSGMTEIATLAVEKVTAGALATTTANFATAMTKGTADSVSISLDGNTSAGTITIGAGFETVNVTATGENKVAALTTAAKTVNITGAGDLEITASLVGAKVIDGSAATGDLTIGAAAIGANLTSVKTGSGDDTVTIVNTNFVTASELAIALGAGDDTLVVAGADNVTKVGALKFKGDALSISGVEFLQLSSNFVLSADVALNTDGLAVDTLIFGGNVGSDGAGRVLTLSKFSGDAITFEGTVVGNTPGTHKVALTAADIKGALTITTEAAATDLGLITLANATSLTINAEAGFTSGDVTAAKITSLTVDADGAVALGTVTGAALTTITATGDAAFGATIDATTTKVTSIDLSGLEGAATIAAGSSAFAGTVTVKVGEGAVTYTSNTVASREVFQFVGDDIGAVTLDEFDIGAGATTDKIDFSQFAGISSADDLVFATSAATITINAAANASGPTEFAGTITIDLGRTATVDDITTLTSNNIIF